MKYARVLGDGNLLIGCNTDEQMEKAKKMKNIQSSKSGGEVGQWLQGDNHGNTSNSLYEGTGGASEGEK